MIKDVYSGSQIWIFPIPDPDSRGQKSTGSGSATSIFNPKVDTKLSEISSRMFIPDPIRELDFFHPGSRFQGPKKALDPESCTATKN
jgi:hypothetical protein